MAGGGERVRHASDARGDDQAHSFLINLIGPEELPEYVPLASTFHWIGRFDFRIYGRAKILHFFFFPEHLRHAKNPLKYAANHQMQMEGGGGREGGKKGERISRQRNPIVNTTSSDVESNRIDLEGDSYGFFEELNMKMQQRNPNAMKQYKLMMK